MKAKLVYTFKKMADESDESSSAKVLVSMREGLSSPNKRGHPSRIRKRNSRFFNEDEDTSFSTLRSPKKQPRVVKTTAKQSVTGTDKRVAQAISVRLRNLLKLPKAHKWVCYEWFYSNLDGPLFQGENDFQICVRESLPQLKVKKMRAVEWAKIRRLMGKPRRCSAAFFAEERAALHEKRKKIRMLQQRKTIDMAALKDLPEEIPLHLVIGTKVTARLRKPQDGLFTGTIDALDTVNDTYRITFNRFGLGTHSVPDYEVRSNEPVETVPLSAFQNKCRPRPAVSRSDNNNSLMSPPRFVPNDANTDLALDNDPLLSSTPFKGQLMSLEGGTYGGFPIKFLVLVTRLSKILQIKKDWIKQLKDMNTECEKRKSYQMPLLLDFQKKYANIVLELENLNKDLNEYLIGVQHYSLELSPEQGLTPMEQPIQVKDKADAEAEDLVTRVSDTMFHNRKVARNESLMELTTKLTSLMLQIKTFSENELNSFEFKSLQDTLSDIRGKLDGNNLNSFKNNVEIHINHIQSGLSQMGNLHAFANSNLGAS